MFKKRKNYLKQIYKVNPETQAFIIEVSLDEYNEVFNGWDPSPIKRRDIDPDLLHFIEECALDIPLKYSLELQFYLPKTQYDQKKEELTRTGIQNNFHFIIHFIKKELSQIGKKILMYIMMSFVFLALAYMSRNHIPLNIVTTTLLEGLFIGGWVFLWEAFSLFFFSRQEINTRLRRYERFLNAPIHFIYQS